MSVPTVSVVIPVYNRPAAVRRAIDSVLAQTFEDLEVVVVDDASSDETPKAVTAVRDQRVRLVRHETRRGGGAARNTGIRASTAPFVAFLDSDDKWLPEKLERQVDLFSRSSDRLGLVYVGNRQMRANGRVREVVPYRDDDLARSLLVRNVVGGTSVGMVRRNVFDEVGTFDESLPAKQDLDLWLRIARRFEVDFVPDVLVETAMGTAGGRITCNSRAVIQGQELFLRKHRSAMEDAGVLHIYLREAGWVRQRWIRNPQAARQYYLASIAARPFAPLAYLFLCGAVLPLRWQDVAARCKDRIKHRSLSRNR